MSLEYISALYAKHWFWSRILNPKKRQPKKRGPKPGRGKPAALPATHTSSSTSSVADLPSPGTAAHAVAFAKGEDAAAQADTAGAVDADRSRAAHRASPFGGQDVQAARAQSLAAPPLAAQNSTTIAAEAAAAASVALAGAASRAASSAAPGQHGLLQGRSMGRSRSLWLGSRRKSTAAPEVMAADAVDQLVEELMVDD